MHLGTDGESAGSDGEDAGESCERSHDGQVRGAGARGVSM
jgi:hypothetical protein